MSDSLKADGLASSNLSYFYLTCLKIGDGSPPKPSSYTEGCGPAKSAVWNVSSNNTVNVTWNGIGELVENIWRHALVLTLHRTCRPRSGSLQAQ